MPKPDYRNIERDPDRCGGDHLAEIEGAVAADDELMLKARGARNDSASFPEDQRRFEQSEGRPRYRFLSPTGPAAASA